jgi:possible relaxase
MQVLMKIAEKQRKSEEDFKKLINHITKNTNDYYGIGVSDNKDIAIRQFMINKKLYKRNRDGKDRFTYYQILSFGGIVDKETIFNITEEYCQKNFYERGFNSFFAIHITDGNIYCDVVVDNVNFETGKMLQSLTQRQYDSEIRKHNKKEVFIYEKQRELFEDICIKYGLDISEKERYKYTHEQKQKEGRTWLTKGEYMAIKNPNSWRNIIKDKLINIYEKENFNEKNISDISKKYGLIVTNHNTEEKTITFGLIIEENNVIKKIKLKRLEEQEREILIREKKTDEKNIFKYDIFFKI